MPRPGIEGERLSPCAPPLKACGRRREAGAGFVAALREGEPRAILFLRVDRIGDMILSLPALRALRARFPRTRITVLASPSNQALLRPDPSVDEVLVLKAGRLRPLHLMALSPALRRRRFDWVLDPFPEQDPLPVLAALLCGARRRIGFGGSLRSRLYHAVLPPPPPGRHFRDLTHDLVRALGAAADPGPPRPVLLEEEHGFARRWLAQQGLSGSALIGIHPGGTYPSQRWPLTHHAALIRMLRAAALGRVVLLGGEGDGASIAAIRRQAGFPLPALVSRDLRRAAAVLARCRLFIGNNSGPLHLAAALGIPTVSFRGPTRAGRWTPLGGPHRVLERPELECLGCERGACPRGSHACLAGISPREAFAAVAELLRETRA